MKYSHQGLIFLIITVVLFSTFEVACKFIVSTLHPFQISLYRFFIGGMVLLPFALYRINKRKTKISLSFFVDMFILGLTNIVVSMSLIQFGLRFTNASTTAVIFSSNPLFVAIFAALILNEPIRFPKLIGMLIGLIGVFILFYEKLNHSSFISIGPLLVLASALAFALYTVLGKRLTNLGVDSMVMTAFSFLAGSLLLIPVMYIINIPLIAGGSSIIPITLYLGIFVSGIAYMCYFYGLAHLPASTGAMIYFGKPALAAFFSVLFLGEKLTNHFFLGTAIIILGLTAANSKILLPNPKPQHMPD